MGDECSPVGIEMGTMPKCATESGAVSPNSEDIVRKENKYEV